MNSPNFRQIPVSSNPEARQYNRTPVNHVNPNVPVFVQFHPSNGYPQQKAPLKTMPDLNQLQERKVKSPQRLNKIEVRNIYDKTLVNSVLGLEPRTSDMSVHSIKQEDEHIDRINNRIKTINEQLAVIFTKLTTHDKQIQQISEASPKSEHNNNSFEKLQKIEDLVWKQVTKQMNQTQQHLAMQNKLVKADLDTLKLQLMCYADKRQVKQVNQKVEENEKLIRRLVRQTQQNNNLQLTSIFAKRKADIQKFEKQVEDIKSKLMEVVFQLEKKYHSQEVCLIRSLNFKVLHEMQVYNKNEEKWLQMGTGETVYGIDQEGNLLDHHDKYITDQRGNLIKLQQKHINLLKKYGLTR